MDESVYEPYYVDPETGKKKRRKTMADQLLVDKLRGLSWAQIAEKHGLTERKVRELLRPLKASALTFVGDVHEYFVLIGRAKRSKASPYSKGHVLLEKFPDSDTQVVTPTDLKRGAIVALAAVGGWAVARAARH